MTKPVFRDIDIQFTSWNDAVKVRITAGEWISFTQNGVCVLSLRFEGASPADLEAAVVVFHKLLPKPVGATVEELAP